MLRSESLKSIAEVSSEHGHDVDDFAEECFARIIIASNFVEDFAVFDEDDARGVTGGEGVVGDHEDGGGEVLVEVAEGFEELAGGFGVEGAGGFVGEDDLGIGDDGAGGGDTLFLAAGELVGVFVEDAGDVEFGGDFADAVDGFLAVDALDGEGEGDVFTGGEGVEEIKVLENEAEFFAAEAVEGVAFELGDVLVFDEDVAAGDAVDGGDDVEEGGFAGAGGSHDGDEFSLVDFEGDVVDGFGEVGAVAVVFFDVLDF